MTILFSAYLAPVQYYTKLYSSEIIVEDRGEHFIKQTYRNRCQILGTRGIETLIVPVEHLRSQGASHTPMYDVRISDHDTSWQRRHLQALRTAYEGSPYFDYYIDDIAPLFEQPFKYLCDWNASIQQTICELIGFLPTVRVSLDYIDAEASHSDLRKVINPKHPLPDSDFMPQPYYQLHGHRTNFVPNLSIVDLLFNMGPETPQVLNTSHPTSCPK